MLLYSIKLNLSSVIRPTLKLKEVDIAVIHYLSFFFCSTNTTFFFPVRLIHAYYYSYYYSMAKMKPIKG